MATYDEAYRKPTFDPTRDEPWCRHVLFAIVAILFFFLPPTLGARPFDPVPETLSLDRGLETQLPDEGRRFTLAIEHAGLLVVEAGTWPDKGQDRASLSLRDSEGRALVPILAPPMAGRRIHWVAPGSYTLEVMPGGAWVDSVERRLRLQAWWVGGRPLRSADAGLDDLAKDGEPTGGEDPPHEPADEWDESPFTLPDPDKDGEPTGGEDPPHEPADEWDEGTSPGDPAPLSQPSGDTLWLEAPGHGLVALDRRGASFFPLCPRRDRPGLLTTLSCASSHRLTTDQRALRLQRD